MWNYLFIFDGAGDWTQGLIDTKHMLGLFSLLALVLDSEKHKAQACLEFDKQIWLASNSWFSCSPTLF
jgi:hypothetical protein